MKLRAPESCTCVSHGGRSFAVVDGSLDVAEDVAAALAAHGFVPWRSGQSDEGAECEPAIDIDRLSRSALFALLREKGVRVSLPISNQDLRAVGRRLVAADE